MTGIRFLEVISGGGACSRERDGQRQAAAAAAARVVNPAPPVKRPATTPSKPVTAPPLPQLSRPTALEPVRNTAGNTPTPDGEALASTRTARPEAQMKPDAIRVQDDLVQKLDPALSGSPSPQPVQPEQPVPVQPAQQSQTFDEMSREQLDSTCKELVAKEMQIRADAAGIPIAQFKVFSLADQIQLGGGAGLPPEEAQRLAAIKERLRKLPMVAPPASVSEPALPTVPLPTPVQPAPNPPSSSTIYATAASAEANSPSRTVIRLCHRSKAAHARRAESGSSYEFDATDTVGIPLALVENSLLKLGLSAVMMRLNDK